MSAEEGSSDSSPYPSNAKIDVGFSDTFLLVISLVGFGAITAIVYSIIVVKLKTNEEIEKENEDEFDYEKRLIRADPSTLNRAERRARARIIRKGRVHQGGGGHEHEGDGEDDGNDHHNDHDEQDDDDDEYAGMSRKERQKAAKIAEREERKMYESQRKQKQLQLQREAQREKREREVAAQKRQEEEKLRLQQEKDAVEQRAQLQYKMFLMTQQKQQTVTEFIESEFGGDDGRQHTAIVSVNDIAKSYGVSNEIVIDRLQQLIDERRIAGIFVQGDKQQQHKQKVNEEDDNDDDDDDDRQQQDNKDSGDDDGDSSSGSGSCCNSALYFVHVPDKVLESIACTVLERGEVSLKDIQKLLATELNL